ncbi:Ribonuclease [Polystyrenella longa]|uniref:Ribonuclease n=1 Tax=Polystyrenella longa TaxID=2528007 RepID=A0A518CU37_9PLAN|nr:MBL fold metallo-hydrolase [Polystyrenella longa]QDU82742.1 Ribonuclease [Polystyrenella longa]
MKITFYGAAGEVTGSQHLVETERHRFLLDCGFFQGHRAESREKNEHFLCDPKDLDAIFLSHAHIDHCGNLPGIYKAGFRGPIFCTPATAEIAEIMLRDSAKIQAEDARYLSKHIKGSHPPFEPLYDEDDVEMVMKRVETLEYRETHELDRGIKVTMYDAGHILGSALMRFEIEDEGEIKRLVFTGDLGRRNMPLLHDPFPLQGCDILIGESTYGNRTHPPAPDVKHHLERIIHEAFKNKGKVIIPAFSNGRTQQVVYYLNELVNENKLPSVPVFVDSPLSNRLTKVYERYQHLLDATAQRTLMDDDNLYHFPGIRYVQSREESMKINDLDETCVIIAASGMCESGRVTHHLAQCVSDEKNIILIIGFQAQHTLGRKLVEKQKYVKIFNKEFPLRAKVEKINGLSGHADIVDMKWWYEHLAGDEGINHTFLVHGEPDSAQALAESIRDICNESPIIPERGQSFEV